ncbi:Qat anti-phage system ATPase QatA [Chromobacterium alticapitis]|uniref:NTPase KAP n=1 Tax=Chromobacterium alticapitis TaxID=2073169 RepID=A0A2S5DCF2_9NEIS|nr:Qat anti-phage system ATPase QatA [Chromobacterium alticapitis]POZ60708.1 NTPase KAP [Chromobacterium alticapitis]
MILLDNETKVDLLNNEAIAATIVALLRERPEHPLTIGVHGDWGAGKSSILEMIETGVATQAETTGKNVLCLKFNGWRFQGFEDAKIALIEGIVSGLIEKQPMLGKAADAVKDIFRRIDWLKVAKKAGGLAFTAFTGVPTADQIQAITSTLKGFIDDPGKLATKENLKSVIDGVDGLLKPAEGKNIPEEIAEFHKAFKELLEKADVDQLIVLIDDLDRCLPETAIETLEAVRLFLFTERTAFVVAADEAMIEYAVRKHFPDLPESTSSQTYARHYLEKLIQVPFRIPALGETETRIYVTLLLVGAELGEENEAFMALIDTAREKLKKPWIGGALDFEAVKTALGSKTATVQEALTLSEQIGPILASGTKGNPRQIKRFLNTLILRQRTADARGFGEDVKLPVLAKLMLAERFLSSVFEQIASHAASSANGKCHDLALLETLQDEVATLQSEHPKELDDAASSSNASTENEEDSPLLKEWRTSPATVAWAQVLPRIGQEDLRPYLFVAKDRKDYFGAVSVLGHLAEIAGKLLGSKFEVQGLEDELKRLAPPEATQVFKLICGRVIGSDRFDTQPAGIDGLVILVKAHPTLQNSLLDFLGSLPSARLGVWVAKGWADSITDAEAISRFNQLCEGWKTTGSPMLKIAVKAAPLRKGGA